MTAAQINEALAQLAKLIKQRPALAAPARLLQEIIPPLFTAQTTPAPHIPAARDPGQPLLRQAVVDLDLEAPCRMVCTATAPQNPHAEALAARFADLRPLDLLRQVLNGNPQAVHERAAELGLDAALAATMLRLAAFPTLAAWADALVPLRQESWDQGHCPVCGSAPLLGEFRGLEQNRFLRCGWCAASWSFSRLRCPHCDNRDHRSLGFLQVEQEETRYRAATCDECHGYVKMAFTLEAPSPPLLLVLDVATIHLDLAAAERGYFFA